MMTCLRKKWYERVILYLKYYNINLNLNYPNCPFFFFTKNYINQLPVFHPVLGT